MTIRSFTVSLTILFMVFCCWPGLRAQSLDHVQGHILVQMADRPVNQSLKSWVADFKGRSGQAFNLRYAREVSKPVDIHLLEFDFTTHNEREVLAELRRHPLVVNAQFNHFLEYRATIPNDPEFVSQWQYINTGQSGGTAGADIDADLAWDYATGGVTATGDTIVVCVIDGGVDANHQDIAPNLWVNRAEIPNNDIDDDNNGFVDDYRGWSSFNGDDSVYDGGGHGTPVAGIVGAKGNDGFGVAGVNWDVKLMIVQGGSGQEAEVLEAYSYPLVARQRYNETDGAEGAFVVATNASWGVDFGQPDDAPLWCAFYDTLGAYGILNCGATINGNVDVDANGDLPTACSSDYLISVTNMNHNDQKVTGAGFGTETIDLGAFGAGTWTTQIGGGFGGFGGTSGATPHVTGTIGLLYSLPCPDIMNAAKADPGSVALLMKQAILEGVDPNQSLMGITTTGGRLNVHNAVLNVLTQCGGCPQPLSPSASVDSDSAAVINFSLINDTTINQVNIQYRPVGDTVWMTMDSVSSPVTLTGLMGCTDYEYQLQSVCDTTSSEYSRDFLFSTLGCCENPETFTAAVVDSNSIQFDWSHVFAAQSYELDSRMVGATEWTTDTVNDNGFFLTGLEACTEYEYRLRTICSDTTATDYTPVGVLTTFGCGACVDLTYCSTPEMSVADEWISSVIIGDFMNESDAGEGGYQDFTESGPSASFAAGSIHDFFLTPAYSGNEFSEGWAIYLDFDQNGDFDGAGERLYQSNGTGPNSVAGAIEIPAGVPEGYTRMRIVMLWNVGAPNSCAANEQGYGEVEDYCVTILPSLPVCANTQISQDTLQGDPVTEVYLEWEAVGPSANYVLRFREEGTSDWENVETQQTDYLFVNLDTCTTYEFQISTACLDGVPSGFSESFVTSTACPPVCAIPGDLTHDEAADATSDSTLTVYWTPTVPGSFYAVRYRVEGSDDEWLEVGTLDTVYQLTALDSCATYEVQIKADCGGGSVESAFSESMVATTACISSLSAFDPTLDQWSVSPNPAGNFVTFEFNLATLAKHGTHASPASMQLNIFDQYGRSVRGLAVDPANNRQLRVDLFDLPAGVYYLRLETTTGVSRVKKLVKL